MKKFFGKKGFTLLELLVVISIIGLLIASGAVAFSTAQKKGRDARRRADMKAFQSAYEQYYAENTTYAACGTMNTQFSGGSAPTDPRGSYVSSCAAASYCVCALLEDLGSGNATNSSCTFGAGNYYCVTNLQ